ncbi:MAG: hypothetical protein ABIP11_09500 [Luteimonas sp.]
MSTRAMGPLAGIRWLKSGINLGRTNAKAIFGGATLVLVGTLLPSAITYPLKMAMVADTKAFGIIMLISMLAGMLLAPLIGGFFVVIDAAEHGRPTKATDVFTLYRRGAFARMVVFGFGMLVLYAIAMGLVLAVVGTDIVHWYMAVLAAQANHHPEAIPSLPAGFGAAMALGSVLWLLIAGVYAIALGQVAVAGRPALDALRDGLLGSLKNLLPLLVLVMVGFFAMLVFILVFALLVMLFALLGKLVGTWLMIVLVVPLYIAMFLALYVVMFGTMYAMWRDICADDRQVDPTMIQVVA